MTEQLTFLDRATVLDCAAEVDLCGVVEDTLRSHARGSVVLPAEGYLPWTNDAGAYCRSLAMLGAVEGPDGGTVRGVKIINAATSNPQLGRERAAGLCVLFDHDTARPLVLAEAGWLSAARTAAYTMVSLRHLGPRAWDALTVIGCGTLARIHVELLRTAFPEVRTVHLYDQLPERSKELAEELRRSRPELSVRLAPEARTAVESAPVLVTTTTTAEGYVPAAWLAPGSFVAHVSLADLLPDAFETAEKLYVDDVELVADNPRRILGGLLGQGRIARASLSTLGEVLTGRAPAVRPGAGHVISNPFGMAILDVALLGAVHEVAARRQLGRTLTLF
ncbi:ornithine cyclodeaminase [Streptomyces iconiensis]|uniref:Ornithine cyclodeaminase n=1 Tax=Streptomyces iconiensis TaxID=1384038 RepID=A0ABT6ZS08_9ACTN|nr:ornithine cyclodeaminase [Streptomyces iconiensis]MDJ1131426.1 ornithine cyclodeaminase [Streptomyces iconiensis]